MKTILVDVDNQILEIDENEMTRIKLTDYEIHRYNSITVDAIRRHLKKYEKEASTEDYEEELKRLKNER